MEEKRFEKLEKLIQQVFSKPEEPAEKWLYSTEEQRQTAINAIRGLASLNRRTIGFYLAPHNFKKVFHSKYACEELDKCTDEDDMNAFLNEMYE